MRVKTSFFGILASFLLSGDLFCEPIDIRVLYQEGYVAVKIKTEADFVELSGERFYLDIGDEFKVGEDSRAGLLIDGKTLMQVEENTEIIIRDFGKGEGDIYIKGGEVNTKFGPVYRAEGYELRTRAATVGIRGTELTVIAQDETTVIAVFSGKVDVDYFVDGNKVSGKSVRLAEGMETEVKYGKPPARPFAIRKHMLKRKKLISKLRKKLPLLKKDYKKMHIKERIKKRNKILKKRQKKNLKKKRQILKFRGKNKKNKKNK